MKRLAQGAKRRRPAVHARLAGLSAPRRVVADRQVYEKGRLRVDFDGYEVFIGGRKVDLYLREFELLAFFVRTPNRVFSRKQLLSWVWGQKTSVSPRTVDVHVRRLRTRIERDDARPELIVTVRRVGYKFDERALAATIGPTNGDHAAELPTAVSSTADSMRHHP